MRRDLPTHMRSDCSILAWVNMRSRNGEVQRPTERCGLQENMFFFCRIFHAHVGDRGSITFHALITLQQRHRNFSYMRSIPPEFTLEKLVQTWSPRFEPFLDESQWPQYTGPIYIADRACRWDKRGSRKRSRHGMAMDQISGRTKRGRARPFMEEPEQNQCGHCGRLGHNSRTCFWTLSHVPINLV